MERIGGENLRRLTLLEALLVESRWLSKPERDDHEKFHLSSFRCIRTILRRLFGFVVLTLEFDTRIIVDIILLVIILISWMVISHISISEFQRVRKLRRRQIVINSKCLSWSESKRNFLIKPILHTKKEKKRKKREFFFSSSCSYIYIYSRLRMIDVLQLPSNFSPFFFSPLFLFDTPTVNKMVPYSLVFFPLCLKRRVLLLLLHWQQPKKIEGHFSRL